MVRQKGVILIGFSFAELEWAKMEWKEWVSNMD